MSTTDLIALAAVGVAFITLVGTFFIQLAVAYFQARSQSRIQRQLEAIKEEYAREREVRQHVLPPEQMAQLKGISDWLSESHRLAREFRNLGCALVYQEEEMWQKDWKRLNKDFNAWDVEYSHCRSLAVRYDAAPTGSLDPSDEDQTNRKSGQLSPKTYNTAQRHAADCGLWRG